MNRGREGVRRRGEAESSRLGRTPRKVNIRDLQRRFLIVCEGEKTEPAYFRGFRVPGNVIDVRGLGDNTLSLVQKALELRTGGEYDQVWCVFDRDSFPATRFNAALELARRNEVHVAYSNEAFEIWYLLHYNYYDTALSRSQYRDMLTQQLGFSYRKNHPQMHLVLFSRVERAIRNAERLLGEYTPHNPESDNPATTVHLLVRELLRRT